MLLVKQNQQKVKKLDNAKIKKIREEFNKIKGRFLKPKTKEIRRNLYEIENKKNFSESKIKEIEKNFSNQKRVFLN